MQIFLPQINPKLSAQKVFLYDPTLIHNTSITDRRTDGRTRDSCNLKNASKIMYSIGLIINVRERKFHANLDVENESSRERKFPGTKIK